MNTIPITLDISPNVYELTVSVDGVTIEQDMAMDMAVQAVTGEHYDGPVTITPGTQAQVLETAGLFVDSNITVAPVPNNYGLITWDGATLTVS